MATITSSALLACSKAGLHCVSNSSKIYRFPTEEKFIMNLSNVCSLNTLFILVCKIDLDTSFDLPRAFHLYHCEAHNIIT